MMIKGKIALLIVAISFLLSNMVYADDATVPGFTSYPKSLIIPFVAKSKKFTLEFVIFNRLGKPLTLRKPQFILQRSASGHSRGISNISVEFVDVRGACQASISTAVMAEQGLNGVCRARVRFVASGVQPNSGQFTPEDYVLSVDYAAEGQQSGTVVSDPVTISFATGQLQQALARTITVQNSCNYPVWVGLHGNVAPNIYSTAEANGYQSDCKSNSDCYTGSVCATNANPAQCVWKNPIPADNNYRLGANGGTTTLTIPVYDNGNGSYDSAGQYYPYELVWSGGIVGRVNCSNKGCDFGDCGGGAGACPAASTGFALPVTTAEMTLIKSRTLMTSKDVTPGDGDSYFVSLINGVTVPVSITPNISALNPYSCGPAGGANAGGPLTSCNWQFTPPSGDYRYVIYTPLVQPGCQTDYDCNSAEFVVSHGTGMVCGITKLPNSSSIVKQCGVPTAFYWTANSVCKASSNAYNNAPFYCASKLPGSNSSYNSLYNCNNIFSQSCYSQGATDSCCGCSDWQDLFAQQPFKLCVNKSNQLWTNIVLPEITWLKKACPLAYAYPDDDASSKFTCRNLDANHRNNVDYTVTFCPR